MEQQKTLSTQLEQQGSSLALELEIASIVNVVGWSVAGVSVGTLVLVLILAGTGVIF